MINIDENEVGLLRSIVSAPREEIEGLYNSEIASRHFEIDKLGDFKIFLKDKLHTASDIYSVSIKRVINLIEKELVQRDERETRIEELCSSLVELNREKARIELEIDDKKNRLKRYLFEGSNLHGEYKVVYRPGFPYLGVVDSSRLPEEFLSPKPDRRKLRKWFETNGEVLPGTELRNRKDTVIVKNR